MTADALDHLPYFEPLQREGFMFNVGAEIFPLGGYCAGELLFVASSAVFWPAAEMPFAAEPEPFPS